MAMAADLPTTAQPKSAWQREQEKHAHARAEDIAYTINHALACTTLDVLNTPVEMLSQHYLGRKISVSYCPGCASGEHGDGFHPDTDTTIRRARRWIVAEVAGDWLGVVPTVMMQRYAPGIMAGVGRGLTYVLGPVFRYGAERSASQWAHEQGISAHGEAARLRADEIYEHEITHLPQAAVWTVASTGLCLAALHAQGDRYTLASNTAAKLIGASVSIVGVLGMRAMAPETARRWDGWTSQNIYLPATKALGKTIGIENADVEHMADKQREFESGTKWKALIERERSAEAQGKTARAT